MDRPILFSAPMVRAILDGKKTQTRRLVKDQAEYELVLFLRVQDGYPDGRPRFVFESDGGEPVGIVCPYGQSGDRLWIRHNFDLFPVYWRPIPGWQGLYAAGTDGLIYRMDRSEPGALQGTPTDRGYLTVSLSRGEWVTKSVHRLVCEAFYGPAPFDGAQVRHMDGDRTNNRPENLDWGTQGDNWQDRKAHGRGMGEQHHAAKLTADDAATIRASALSQRALARKYGVSQSTIGEIRTGRSWTTHAPGLRNAPAWKPWRSPIHMPRWASRLTLEVTGVRVERLQDISDDDARAEGVERNDLIISGFDEGIRYRDYAGNDDMAEWFSDPVRSYRTLWESIHGPGAWDANPWVWVVEFKRVNVEADHA